MNENRARMLTAAEAASRLGVKLGTLYAYVSRGWLRSYRRRAGRHALYRRADIEALRTVAAAERGMRARSVPDATSWVTVAQPRSAENPAPGVIVAESAVSAIIDGRIAYRGYPIEEVVAHASFEEACLLLWNGERPPPGEIGELRREIERAAMPAPVAEALDSLGRKAPALLRLAAMMPSLAAWERMGRRLGNRERAKLIIAMLPLPLLRGRDGDGGVGGTAQRLLRSIARGTPSDWKVAALDQIMVACAEHELNASTFAARVVASTGADLYAAVTAALCSLSGPIHGGACDRIERMLAELGGGGRIERWLDDLALKRRLAPGFGHAIYPLGDPRAALLRETAAAIARRRGRALYETALKLERAVYRRDGLRPNLDFYLTVCTRMLGFPRGLPAAIFAVARAAGWIAHSLEQYADNRLIRPRLRYRGVSLRHWT